MNVRALLTDTTPEPPLIQRENREREREREREEERERKWERGRERERERDGPGEHFLSSTAAIGPTPTSSAPSPHRPYSPVNSTFPFRTRLHNYDAKLLLPPRAGPPIPAQRHEHREYDHTAGPETAHSRSYSGDIRPQAPPSSSHSHNHSHSPTTSMYLSPSPREALGGGSAAAAVPPNNNNNIDRRTPPEYSAPEYHDAHRERAHLLLDRDRERQRAMDRDREWDRDYMRMRSSSGSARSPPYGDYRTETGRATPIARSVPRSPAHSPYSVVPPTSHSHQHSLSQQHLSPPHVLGSSNSGNGSSGSMLGKSTLSGPASAHAPPLQSHSLPVHSHSRRPGPTLPNLSLPPPPSALPASKQTHAVHDGASTALTTTTMSGALRPSSGFDEPPYHPSSTRAPMASLKAGREPERSLKDDLDREREEKRLRQGREREREAELLSRSGHSGRISNDGTPIHNSPPGPVPIGPGANGEGEWMRRDRELDMTSRIQMSPRDGRERDREKERERDYRDRESDRDAQQPLHHHLTHTHSHSQSQQHLHSHSPQQSSEIPAQYPSQQLPPTQESKQKPHSTPTHTMTGKPRVSRSGVLKLAPPGVAVHNYPPPSSSDPSLVNSLQSGLILRADPMRVQQQVNNNNQTSKVSKPDPHNAEMQLPSPPPQSARAQHEQPPSHQRQRSRSSGTHNNPYPNAPIGPGVPPPPNAGLPMRDMSMLTQQHQKPQQHTHHFNAPGPHNQQQQMHSHQHSQHSLPTPPSSTSSNIPTSGPGISHPSPHHPPYRQIPPPLLPPQHQGYIPPSVHSYNEAPPPPVPMALQPMVRTPPPPPEPVVSETPVNLGTFVFPRTPFPYFFPSRRESESRRTALENENITSPNSLKRRREIEFQEPRDKPTHVTILIPYAFLPSAIPSPTKPRVWGGATITTSMNESYFTGAPFGMYVQRPPQTRRVYTDDSDLGLAAMHAGKISWSGIKRAKAAKLDLKVTLSLYRDVGRYAGSRSAVAEGAPLDLADLDRGLKSLLKGRGGSMELRDEEEDRKGWSMITGTWESGHDGSGVEISSAEWIPQASARKLGLRNRSQRMREYAERRRAIMDSETIAESPLKKRKMPHGNSGIGGVLTPLSNFASLDLSSASLSPLAATISPLPTFDPDISSSRVLVFGNDGWVKCFQISPSGKAEKDVKKENRKIDESILPEALAA